MNQNQAEGYANQLSSHASLLLSASPTIVTSPLQNNSNNPQAAPQPSSIALIRRQPSTPLLSASNLDNDSHFNTDSPTNSNLPEGYINFKKPQNEMFKKLDGKIQKIVAAHSNLNKLYALNDFSGSAGPRRPFELPAQLPPPPPWVPKVNSDCAGAWAEDSINPLSTSPDAVESKTEELKPGPSILNSGTKVKPSKARMASNLVSPRSPSLTIDSAITKLHQRRQQQQQLLQKRPSQLFNRPQSQHALATRIKHPPNSISAEPTSATLVKQNATITPAQFTLLTQKIRETFEKRGQGNNDRSQSLSADDKKEFKDQLIAILKDEIASVSKSANLSSKFSQSTTKPKIIDQKSLLMKTSPQSLFNTVRRETSILLSKRDQSKVDRSILNDQQQVITNHRGDSTSRLPIAKTPHIIKVIVPPSDTCPSKTEGIPKDVVDGGVEVDKYPASTRSKLEKDHNLSYQIIRSKIRSFQETNQIYLGYADSDKLNISPCNPLNLKKKRNTQKSLDKIVDRLQAKCSLSPTDPDLNVSQSIKPASLHQQILNSSANLLQTSRAVTTISAPTPIPVFRSPVLGNTRGAVYSINQVTSKASTSKTKKFKRTHHFGLKLGNYLEKECPQPTTDKLTIEQFARCLDLVRSNDISLQRHQEQLLHSEAKWRMPISNRPLRLRRIRGERIHMPASASYRATSKVGLQ